MIQMLLTIDSHRLFDHVLDSSRDSINLSFFGSKKRDDGLRIGGGGLTLPFCLTFVLIMIEIFD